MLAALAVVLLCFLAQLSEVLAVVEHMGEALLLFGRGLAPGPFHLRLRCVRAVLAKTATELVDREPGTGLTDRHRVEVGAIPILVGEDGLAGGRQHLGRLAPFRPGVETGDGEASLAGKTFEEPVCLDMPLRRRQIALGGLLRGGLVVVVREELVKHIACTVGQAAVNRL